MTDHYLQCYQRARESGFHHFADAIAALYLKERGLILFCHADHLKTSKFNSQ